jgi:Mlc titration factor MtfA (ptsG expression regulator)
LRDYGGTDPGEFFAVATEAFFDLPAQLEEAKPDLYGVLRGFYRQDPAARARRSAGPQGLN